MPGGIGRVSESVQAHSAGRERVLSAAAGANEIFFHLDARNAYFDRAAGALYFVDAAGDAIMRTLTATLLATGTVARFEQLHLDTHCFFNAARRLMLDEAQRAAALTALRLIGVRITLR
ncbi:MAG: hypothetical protein KDI82_06590 [Gammaproteobacteria bacterium]|nr:hypothetical protein [Gammaproteobacteria bacterium]